MNQKPGIIQDSWKTRFFVVLFGFAVFAGITLDSLGDAISLVEGQQEFLDNTLLGCSLAFSQRFNAPLPLAEQICSSTVQEWHDFGVYSTTPPPTAPEA